MILRANLQNDFNLNYNEINSIFDVKQFVSSYYNFFKKHLKNIINNIKNIKNSIKQTLSKIKKDIINIKKELINISLKLREYKFFKKEFLNFLKIKEMVEYIINKNLIQVKTIEFIENLLINFYNLIDEESKDMANKNEKLNKFNLFIYSQEDYFYSNIFNSSRQYDDSFVKITNILG